MHVTGIVVASTTTTTTTTAATSTHNYSKVNQHIRKLFANIIEALHVHNQRHKLYVSIIKWSHPGSNICDLVIGNEPYTEGLSWNDRINNSEHCKGDVEGITSIFDVLERAMDIFPDSGRKNTFLLALSFDESDPNYGLFLDKSECLANAAAAKYRKNCQLILVSDRKYGILASTFKAIFPDTLVISSADQFDQIFKSSPDDLSLFLKPTNVLDNINDKFVSIIYPDKVVNYITYSVQSKIVSFGMHRRREGFSLVDKVLHKPDGSIISVYRLFWNLDTVIEYIMQETLMEDGAAGSVTNIAINLVKRSDFGFDKGLERFIKDIVECDELGNVFSADFPITIPECLKYSPFRYSDVAKRGISPTSPESDSAPFSEFPHLMGLSLGSLKSDSEIEFYSFYKFIGQIPESRLNRICSSRTRFLLPNYEKSSHSVLRYRFERLSSINHHNHHNHINHLSFTLLSSFTKCICISWASFALSHDTFIKFQKEPFAHTFLLQVGIVNNSLLRCKLWAFDNRCQEDHGEFDFGSVFCEIARHITENVAPAIILPESLSLIIQSGSPRSKLPMQATYCARSWKFHVPAPVEPDVLLKSLQKFKCWFGFQVCDRDLANGQVSMVKDEIWNIIKVHLNEDDFGVRVESKSYSPYKWHDFHRSKEIEKEALIYEFSRYCILDGKNIVHVVEEPGIEIIPFDVDCLKRHSNPKVFHIEIPSSIPLVMEQFSNLLKLSFKPLADDCLTVADEEGKEYFKFYCQEMKQMFIFEITQEYDSELSVLPVTVFEPGNPSLGSRESRICHVSLDCIDSESLSKSCELGFLTRCYASSLLRVTYLNVISNEERSFGSAIMKSALSQMYEISFDVDFTSFLNIVSFLRNLDGALKTKLLLEKVETIFQETLERHFKYVESDQIYVHKGSREEPMWPLFIRMELSILPKGDPTSRSMMHLNNRFLPTYPDKISPKGFSFSKMGVKASDDTKAYITVVCLSCPSDKEISSLARKAITYQDLAAKNYITDSALAALTNLETDLDNLSQLATIIGLQHVQNPTKSHILCLQRLIENYDPTACSSRRLYFVRVQKCLKLFSLKMQDANRTVMEMKFTACEENEFEHGNYQIVFFAKYQESHVIVVLSRGLLKVTCFDRGIDLDLVTDAIFKICFQINQSILLQELFDRRFCSKYLLERDDVPSESSSSSSSSSSGESDGESDSIFENGSMDVKRKPAHPTSIRNKVGLNSQQVKKWDRFQVAEFKCSLVFTYSFQLHWRLTANAALNSLISLVLQPFAISNRKNLYVYRIQNGHIFYLRFHEIVHETEQETSKNPSALSEIFNFSGSKGALSSRKSTSLKMEVFGLETVNEEISVQLVHLIESKLLNLTFSRISVSLARNSSMRLSREDVDILLPADREFEFEHILKVPLFCLIDLPQLIDCYRHCIPLPALATFDNGFVLDRTLKSHFGISNCSELDQELYPMFIYHSVSTRSPSTIEIQLGSGLCVLVHALMKRVGDDDDQQSFHGALPLAHSFHDPCGNPDIDLKEFLDRVSQSMLAGGSDNDDDSSNIFLIARGWTNMGNSLNFSSLRSIFSNCWNHSILDWTLEFAHEHFLRYLEVPLNSFNGNLPFIKDYVRYLEKIYGIYRKGNFVYGSVDQISIKLGDDDITEIQGKEFLAGIWRQSLFAYLSKFPGCEDAFWPYLIKGERRENQSEDNYEYLLALPLSTVRGKDRKLIKSPVNSPNSRKSSVASGCSEGHLLQSTDQMTAVHNSNNLMSDIASRLKKVMGGEDGASNLSVSNAAGNSGSASRRSKSMVISSGASSVSVGPRYISHDRIRKYQSPNSHEGVERFYSVLIDISHGSEILIWLYNVAKSVICDPLIAFVESTRVWIQDRLKFYRCIRDSRNPFESRPETCSLFSCLKLLYRFHVEKLPKFVNLNDVIFLEQMIEELCDDTGTIEANAEIVDLIHFLGVEMDFSKVEPFIDWAKLKDLVANDSQTISIQIIQKCVEGIFRILVDGLVRLRKDQELTYLTRNLLFGSSGGNLSGENAWTLTKLLSNFTKIGEHEMDLMFPVLQPLTNLREDEWRHWKQSTFNLYVLEWLDRCRKYGFNVIPESLILRSSGVFPSGRDSELLCRSVDQSTIVLMLLSAAPVIDCDTAATYKITIETFVLNLSKERNVSLRKSFLLPDFEDLLRNLASPLFTVEYYCRYLHGKLLKAIMNKADKVVTEQTNTYFPFDICRFLGVLEALQIELADKYDSYEYYSQFAGNGRIGHRDISGLLEKAVSDDSLKPYLIPFESIYFLVSGHADFRSFIIQGGYSGNLAEYTHFYGIIIHAQGFYVLAIRQKQIASFLGRSNSISTAASASSKSNLKFSSMNKQVPINDIVNCAAESIFSNYITTNKV